MSQFWIPPQAVACLPLAITAALYFGIAPANGQVPEANYDESKAVVENLPNLLSGPNGQQVNSAQQWDEHRSYLVNQLAEFEYGFAPNSNEPIEVSSKTIHEGLLKDSNTRLRELDVTIKVANKEHTVALILFMPPENVPVTGTFLMPNFSGNHTLSADPSIRLTESWMRNDPSNGITNNKTNAGTRSGNSRRTPIDSITGRGYILASVYYGDIDPDFDDGFGNGVHSLFPQHKIDEEHPARWGTIAGWAWGLSRCVDALLEQPEVKADRIAVIGHSRLGKTALWAGATDTRFSLVFANNSGCGGAALCRRNFGETVWRINTAFPHWFNSNFKKYNQDPAKLPIDQHMLIASIAPRPVYIASATKDTWADPKGEYMSAYLANAAYELLGKKGLPSPNQPEPGVSVGESIGYHLRDGEHDMLAEDWEHYMNFADRHWK